MRLLILLLASVVQWPLWAAFPSIWCENNGSSFLIEEGIDSVHLEVRDIAEQRSLMASLTKQTDNEAYTFRAELVKVDASGNRPQFALSPDSPLLFYSRVVDSKVPASWTKWPSSQANALAMRSLKVQTLLVTRERLDENQKITSQKMVRLRVSFTPEDEPLQQVTGQIDFPHAACTLGERPWSPAR